MLEAAQLGEVKEYDYGPRRERLRTALDPKYQHSQGENMRSLA